MSEGQEEGMTTASSTGVCLHTLPVLSLGSEPHASVALSQQEARQKNSFKILWHLN